MATKKEQGPLESGNRRTLIRSWGWQPCVFTLGLTQTHAAHINMPLLIVLIFFCFRLCLAATLDEL